MRTVLSDLEDAGADIKEALRQIGGEEKIYLFVLNKFMNDKGIYELNNALADNDMSSAFDIAHTLKGMYGAIYFQDEYGLCSEIVELLRNNEDIRKVYDKLEVLNGLHRQKLDIMKGRID